MHDDTQVARVVVMGRALRDGQFPVRMVSDLGFGLGYPVFNFYGPLPYYVGGFLYAVGLDSVIATKIMFGIGAVLAPITLYALLLPAFGTIAALAGAIVFLFAPYHAVQIYVRGSVGEYWAIALVPLVLSGLIRALKEKHFVAQTACAGLALAGVITAHTIFGFLTCAMLLLGICIFWAVKLVRHRLTKKDIMVPVGVAILGLLLSGFFWLPALLEMYATSVTAMVQSAGTTFFDHFVCISQLWNSPWGFAGSASGCVDGMSFKFGRLHVVFFAAAVSLLLYMRKNRKVQEKNAYMKVATVFVLLCSAGMLAQSAPLWRMIPYTAFIQYPWRLLAFGMMGIAVGAAYVVSVFRIPFVRILLASGIIVSTMLVNVKLFVPQTQYVRDSSAFESFEELRFYKSKISDEYLPSDIVRPTAVGEVAKVTVVGESTFSVTKLIESSTFFLAEIKSDTAQKITIRKAWFPGWQMTVNGKQVYPKITYGLTSVNIQEGMSIIELRFRDTPVRMLGNWMSIVGLLAIGAIYIYGKKANT